MNDEIKFPKKDKKLKNLGKIPKNCLFDVQPRWFGLCFLFELIEREGGAGGSRCDSLTLT